MNNFSKMLVGSSLVLGAVLFSVGCGGDSFCCKDGEPPIPKIVGESNTISLDGKTTHTFNGLTTAGMDDGTIVKCNWYIDGKLQSYTESSCSNVELNFAGMSGSPEVCLEVIDNEGISSKENNGKIKEDVEGASSKKKGNLELRKKMDCKIVAITPENHAEPFAKISVFPKGDLMSNCNVITAADAGSTPGEGTISEYLWRLGTSKDSLGNANDKLVGNVHQPDYDLAKMVSDGRNHIVVCLSVKNSIGTVSNEVCEERNIVDYSNPKAVLDVKNIDGSAVDHLSLDSKYNLSCDNSDIACPTDKKKFSCEFGGRSYKMPAGATTCDWSSKESAYVSDCVSDGRFTVDGTSKNTLSPSEVATGVNMTITTCSTASFNCVDIWLEVNDEKVNGYKSERVMKSFPVR